MLVGTEAIDQVVPAHYQASAFPAFAALAIAAAIERDPRRVALLTTTSALAIARLDGRLPVSGHATFLAAATAFELTTRATEARHVRLALAIGGLGVTAYYKLAAWNDTTWFATSTLLGTALGAAFAQPRARRTSDLR